MNDEQLESLLRAADESAVAPADPFADLADRARGEHSRIRQRAARVRFTVALVGCYAAGMLTMWAAFGFSYAATEVADRVPRQNSSAEPNTDVPPAPRHEPEIPQRVTAPRPAPLQPTLVAETSRYELLRQMGDESQRRGDLQAAVAYYGQALDAATHIERQIAYAQDNWLLISLKKDRVASQSSPAEGDSI